MENRLFDLLNKAAICRVLSGPSSRNERDHNDLQKWPCDRIKF